MTKLNHEQEKSEDKVKIYLVKLKASVSRIPEELTPIKYQLKDTLHLNVTLYL